MKKIPVFETIKAAYGFVFAHLGAIIGLIWVPMVGVTILGFFVEQRYYNAAADALASNNYVRLGPSVISLLCYFMAAILLYAVMFVPVTQLALAQRKDGAVFHFALGPAERRMFRALAGLMAFLFLPFLITAYLFRVVAAMTVPGRGASLLAAGGAEVLLVLSCFALACIALRFAFLLPAVAVNEEGPVLPRAWILSGGNFWRILGIVLATLGPVALAGGAIQYALQGPRAVMPQFANSSAMAAAQLHQIAQHMPINKGVDFLMAPLILGLFAGASAFAMGALQDGGVKRPTLPL
jgi:hypothetical protein